MIKSVISTLIFFWIAIFSSYSQHQHKIKETVTYQYYDTSKDSSLYKDVSEFDSNGNLLVYVFSIWDNELHNWLEGSKQEQQYDRDGNQIFTNSYEWDKSAGKWIECSYKWEFFYDTNGKVLKNISYDWHKDLGKYIGDFKYEYTYNANGNLLSDIVFEWDRNLNNWIESSKHEYSYDNRGNQILWNYYMWDKALNKWTEFIKTEYISDNNGKRLSFKSYDWDLNLTNWVESGKGEYSYDTNGNLISEVQYSWDKILNKWIERIKEDYTYDINRNQLSDVYSEWNIVLGKWIEHNKTESTYDTRNNKLSYTLYKWDNDIKGLVENTKDEFSYDINGDQILHLRKTWDLGNWKVSEKIITTISFKIVNNKPTINDLNLTIPEDTGISSVIGKLVSSDPDVDNLAFSIISGNDAGTYSVSFSGEIIVEKPLDYEIDKADTLTVQVSDGELTSSCSVIIKITNVIETNIDLPDDSPSKITIYPNPVTEILYLNATLEKKFDCLIYGVNGKTMYHSKIQGLDSKISINIANLKPGAYFLYLTNNGKVEVLKFIKQ
jgi:hypothetical protein